LFQFFFLEFDFSFSGRPVESSLQLVKIGLERRNVPLDNNVQDFIIADPKVNQMENVTVPVQQGLAEPGTLSRFREQYLSG
jgi:hypothetical protein